MKLKYLINHFMGLQPQSIGIERIVRILEKDHNISRSTFHRDRSIALDSENSISIERLDVYAGLFGVSIDELKNYPTKKIKPLSERKQSALTKKVIKKGKLIKGNNSKS